MYRQTSLKYHELLLEALLISTHDALDENGDIAKRSSSPLFNPVLAKQTFTRVLAPTMSCFSLKYGRPLCISPPTPVRTTAGRFGGLDSSSHAVVHFSK